MLSCLHSGNSRPEYCMLSVCGSQGHCIWQHNYSNNTINRSNFSMIEVKNFVNSVHHQREFIYFLDRCGMIWKWHFGFLHRSVVDSIPDIPSMSAMAVSNKHAYFVAEDGSLWCEGSFRNGFVPIDSWIKDNTTVKKISGLHYAVLNIFCDSCDRVFILCENGRILISEADEKIICTEFGEWELIFSELCSCSNVIQIAGNNNLVQFLLDNGNVFTYSTNNYKLLSLTKNITYIQDEILLNNKDQLIVKEKIIDTLKDIGNTPFIPFEIAYFHWEGPNRVVISNNKQVGLLHTCVYTESIYNDFGIADKLPQTRINQKSARK